MYRHRLVVVIYCIHTDMYLSMLQQTYRLRHEICQQILNKRALYRVFLNDLTILILCLSEQVKGKVNQYGPTE
jgi:hypothetical protein